MLIICDSYANRMLIICELYADYMRIVCTYYAYPATTTCNIKFSIYLLYYEICGEHVIKVYI